MSDVYNFQPGENHSIILDLSCQPEALGKTDLFAAETISSVTAGKTVVTGSETTTLDLGTPTIVGTGDKLNKAVKLGLSGGTDATEVKITFTVTWSGGGIKDYEVLVKVTDT